MQNNPANKDGILIVQAIGTPIHNEAIVGYHSFI